jgi:hypothetical protein
MRSALAILAMMLTWSAAATDRAGRPMIIHRLAELGLEIWTEQDPEWEAHIDEHAPAPTFVAETPALAYPPAHMSWTTVPQLKFHGQEFEAGARGALHQVATNYRVQAPQQIPITPQHYGDLHGYETVFEARSQNIPIEVRAFCGHRPGKHAVLMQVTTFKGKLPHLTEHLRRSWRNTRYLK